METMTYHCAVSSTPYKSHVHSSVQLCLHKAAHTSTHIVSHTLCLSHEHVYRRANTHALSVARAQTLERPVSQQCDYKVVLKNDPSTISPQRQSKLVNNAVQTHLLVNVERLTDS